MRLKLKIKPFSRSVFYKLHKLCSSLIFWSCMITGGWIGIVYVLVFHGDLNSESETVSVCVVCETTDCPIPILAAEKPAPLAADSSHTVDWELLKVLAEMDIRNPSPEHEAFLEKYLSTKRE